VPDRALRLLIALQVAAILVLGAVTVARFSVWALVDERAHYAVVQVIAEDGRLPRIGELVSPEVQAITDDTFPRPSPNDPRTYGLAGRVYEAFQPPLYYGLAAPAFLVPVNHEAKLRVLRALDLALLAAALALLAALARAVFADRWRAPFALALSVLLWPAVIVRIVTVSNTALELPLALACALALWRARTPRGVAVAAGLFGALMLTKLSLAALVVPLAAVAGLVAVRARRPAALAALAIPAVLLTPWLAWNLDAYGTLTANAQALAQQAPFLYADGERPGAGDLPARLAALTEGALPQEWVEQLERPAIGVAARALPVALVLLALAGIARRPRAVLRSRAALVLGAPVLLGMLTMVATLVAERHDIFLLRYVFPVLPAFALFAAWAWAGERAPARLALGSSVVAALLWVWMAGTYYFADVGRTLGIG